MKMQQLELRTNEYDLGTTTRHRKYAPRGLEFGVTAVYNFLDSGGGGGGFQLLPLLQPLQPLQPAGTSFFSVELPESNAMDRSIKITTPENKVIINANKRIKTPKGIDYFNTDGSLAGRIKGLNPEESSYLDYMDLSDE